MDVVLIVICASFVIGFLVFIHEGGHFLAARSFGVRVTEFMLGMPGPSLSFTHGETRFGVTCVPLGGYARVCGMEPGEMSPHLQGALASVYRRGAAVMEEVANDCGITDDEAYQALEELVEWGSVIGPEKRDRFNTYRTPGFSPTKRQMKRAAARGEELRSWKRGDPRPVDDEQELFEAEYRQQYRFLPFWKRAVILAAGPFMNLLFTVVAFVVLYSVIGLNYQYVETGEIVHVTLSPIQAIQAGFMYIGAVLQMIVSLFNPSTAADVVSQSTSIVGIAIMSKDALSAGVESAISFMAAISVSLGLMNLLPIPPLDGGKLIIEVFQKVSRRVASPRVVNYLSVAGMVLFLGFFAVMLNQDIQRFVFGNWG